MVRSIEKSSNLALISLLQSWKSSSPSKIHWPLSYPRRADLSRTLSIDFEMIGIVNPEWGHHVMIDFPVEVGIGTVFRFFFDQNHQDRVKIGPFSN